MSAPRSGQPEPDWLVPDWPAPPGVHALCTTRAGGVSRPPFDSLNLGTHVGDDPAAVQANRQRLQAVLASAGPPARPVFLNQVHGNEVVQLDPATTDGSQADASVAATPGVACAIMVADCLPVLLAHQSQVVAAAHAGWRGLVGTSGRGVLEAVFERFQALALENKAHAAIQNIANPSPAMPTATGGDTVASDTLAWLGPCIGPQAFEVGAEVHAAFCAANPEAASCFAPRAGAAGKYWCDLAGLARQRLWALGITQVYGNDSTPPWCTAANASRFFSHRRDAATLGGSGRFAACIWIG